MKYTHRALVCLSSVALSLAIQSQLAHAALTDISSTPLANTAEISAKPNLMFILDSSGSMAWGFMPDDLGQDFSQPNNNPTDTIALSRYGGRSIQCNGVAYDPNFSYSDHLPVKPDGTSYPNIPFNAAPTDGYQTSISNAKSLVSPINIGTGDQSFKVSGSLTSTSFSAGNAVTLVNSNDDTQWMVGTVKTWSNPNLVVTISAVVGNPSSSDTWQIGTRDTTDLNNNSYYYKYNVTDSSAKTALSWKYTTAGLDRVNDGGFANECLTSTSTTLSTFTKVTVTSSSAEAQNYANWYSYYRKRYLLMRTVAGRSFSGVDTKFRVGFTTINDTTAAPSSTFLPVNTFDSTQKATFFSDLYKADPSGSTPLRGALSKVGRYFANKASGQTSDPMQYACQRNYALLSTDGYWNTNLETSTYGPLKLDGKTKVGQQDGNEVRPFKDSTITTITTVTPYTITRNQDSVYDKTTVSIVSTTPASSSYVGCGGFKRRYTTTATQSRRTLVETITERQTLTGSYTTTQITINGVASPLSTSSTSWGATTVTNRTSVTKSDTTPAATAFSVTGTCKSSPYDIPTLTGSQTSTASTLSNIVDSTTAGTASTSTNTTAGASDTLADVAEYYYVTDLRNASLNNCTGGKRADDSAGDVCNDEVPPNGSDNRTTQHMTTFTLGLGVNGTLPYLKDYEEARSGTYYDIKNNLNGTEWPNPNASSEDATNVDDLWHAAVNGRGIYWSAKDPGTLSSAIATALSKVEGAEGASSSAATSSLKPVSGQDNQVFVATFRTVDWWGDLKAYTLDPKNGTIDMTKPVWSAKELLDAKTPSTRKIYYAKPNASTPTLREFTYSNLSADGLGTYFAGACNKTPALTQCEDMDADPMAAANNGTNLVNYLRGDRSLNNYLYTVNNTTQSAEVYGVKAAVLGDIVNASPVYMKKPPFSYVDTGYTDFVAAQSNRKAVVFAAANDGMLHAFSATVGSDTNDGGAELWAYVPRKVMPNLYILADSNYKDKHRYFVDGTPVIGDVKDPSTGAWKTILVGGLNSGGNAYYALDVTDPENPKALWEFSNDNDANLGLTYGNPIITKLANGNWVVAFTSGYNNNAGDGNGHLYILNALTGTNAISSIGSSIPTLTASGAAVGSKTTPSGLGKINVWVEDDKDNTAKRFYGGDMLGNLWRFDPDGLISTQKPAVLLATFQTSGAAGQTATPQPITTKPETAAVAYSGTDYPIVVVGTGQYLGITDIANKNTQSIYAIKDTLSTTGLGDVRARTDLVTQSLTASGNSVTSSNNNVNWASQIGWKVDLPTSGERVAIDMQLQYTTLSVITAVPGTNECNPAGGSSWLYGLEISKGNALPTKDNVAADKLGNYLGVGMTWIQLSDGSSRLIIPRSDGKVDTATPAISNSSFKPPPHRTSWRELMN